MVVGASVENSVTAVGVAEGFRDGETEIGLTDAFFFNEVREIRTVGLADGFFVLFLVGRTVMGFTTTFGGGLLLTAA